MTETLTLQPAYHIKDELNFMFNEVEGFTCLSPDSLIELDVAAHGAAVNALLLQTSELVQTKFRRGQSTASKHKKTLGRGADLIGADLRKTDLRGANLRGAYLIAADLRGVDLSGADLIGADLRDTDLRGANLECSIFLTQTQVNATKGDAETKLSMALVRPMYWSK